MAYKRKFMARIMRDDLIENMRVRYSDLELQRIETPGLSYHGTRRVDRNARLRDILGNKEFQIVFIPVDYPPIDGGNYSIYGTGVLGMWKKSTISDSRDLWNVYDLLLHDIASKNKVVLWRTQYAKVLRETQAKPYTRVVEYSHKAQENGEQIIAELNKLFFDDVASDIEKVLVSQEKAKNLTDMKNWEELVEKIYEVENRTPPEN